MIAKTIINHYQRKQAYVQKDNQPAFPQWTKTTIGASRASSLAVLLLCSSLPLQVTVASDMVERSISLLAPSRVWTLGQYVDPNCRSGEDWRHFSFFCSSS